METVLIVDDEKNYPPILAAVLEEEGYEAWTANSGEEALAILGRIEDAVVRPPLQPIAEAEREQIRRALIQTGLLTE